MNTLHFLRSKAIERTRNRARKEVNIDRLIIQVIITALIITLIAVVLLVSRVQYDLQRGIRIPQDITIPYLFNYDRVQNEYKETS